ncbi:putative methyltransferase [Bacteroidales bacterium Barb4]|nr:putative methyltransferase [Bacteroidales bacterium Barb4]
MDKLKMQSVDITGSNIEKIAALFPSVVTEAKDENGVLHKAIDFEKLKLMLSTNPNEMLVIDDETERYDFTWVGKRQAIADSATPIRKTLRPCVKESKNWDTTENIYIEGDNLEVLKLLQESYLGKVKMIYIDPPYNTGNDFIYRDDFSQTKDEYENELGVFDEEGNRLFKNTETNGRFHSDWCSMIYPRLMLARNLLTDDGVIFISIDDNEVAQLKKICDEVFGEDNFINAIVVNMNSLSGVKMTHAITGKRFPAQKEFLLLYKKGVKQHSLYIGKKNKEKWDKEYNLIIPELMKNQFVSFDEMSDKVVNNLLSKMHLISLVDYAKDSEIELSEEWKWHNAYRIFGTKSNTSLAKRINNKSYSQQIVCYTNNDGNKRFFRSDYNKEARDPRIELVQAEANSSVFLSDNWIDISNDGGVAQEGGIIFPNGKKPLLLIERMLKASNCDDAIVLDFFSGSATTAHAVMQLNVENGGNRKFIMVQLPEECAKDSEAYKAGYKNICEIGKERIRRAGAKLEEQQSAKNSGLPSEESQKLDTGFRVFKLDSTNMKDVYYSAGEYQQKDLLDLISNIKEDRNDIDLLYSCLIDWGVPLSLPHKQEKINGQTVHFVNETDLIACFDEKISEDTIRTIAKHRPSRVVFRDVSFKDSADKINVTEIFKAISPETTIKVI